MLYCVAGGDAFGAKQPEGGCISIRRTLAGRWDAPGKDNKGSILKETHNGAVRAKTLAVRHTATGWTPYFAGAGALLFAASPAWAACVPNGPVPSGSTVTCTGTDTTGVGDGTQNNVVVTVQPGASVTLGNNASDIHLNDNNTVTNNGTITAGNNASGIQVGNNNTVTNNGAIVLGTTGFGMQANAASTIVNTGTIFVGSGAGISSAGFGSSITNSGSVTLAAGGMALLTVGSDASPIINSGALTLLTGSGTGIFTQGDNSAATNSGAITISNSGGRGIFTLGISSGIVNSGAINVKVDGVGLETDGSNSVIVNSGAISFGGLGSTGILTTAANSGVFNTGAISVVGGPAIGTVSSNSGITNSGMITVGGDGAFALRTFGTGSAIANSGALQMTGANGTGIFSLGDSSAITNSGAISLAGNGSIGLQTSGIGSAISNTAAIALAGTNGVGIETASAGSSVFNSGAVSVVGGIGIRTLGSNSGITNSGIITVGGDSIFAVQTFGAGSAIINSGTIQATGPNAFAVFTEVGNVTNSGTVTAPHGGGIETNAAGTSVINSGVVQGIASLSVTGGASIVSNTGLLDGRLDIIGAGNTFTNSGVLTTTTAELAVGAAHLVTGTFTQTAAGTLALRVTNDGAHDAMRVTGTANLGGTLGAVVQPGLYANATTYLGVLTATSPLSSRFAQAAAFAAGTTTPLTFFTATPTYNSNSVDLTLNRVAFNAAAGETQNQRNVGTALESAYAATLTGAPATLYSALLQSTSLGVLTQAAGETATGSQQTTFNAMNMFMGVMTDPFVDRRGDSANPAASAPNGYASTQKTGAARDAYAMFTKAPVTPLQRWSVWAASFGGSQTTDGNVALGSNTATSSVYGTAVGADYRFSPDTIAGFSLAGGGTNFSVANAGSGRSDLFQAGAFIRHSIGPAYISAALAYGWQDVTTDRTLAIAGIDHLHAEFNANAFSGRAEGGYRLVTPWTGGVGITPYAAAQSTTFDLPAYSEGALSGASTLALSYGAKTVTDARSELGLRTDKSYAMPDAILTLRGRFAWAHDFDPDRSVAATFQALPGASFVVNGAAQANNSALTTASAEVKWLNGFSLAATFEGEFSDVTRSYAGKGVARYAW